MAVDYELRPLIKATTELVETITKIIKIKYGVN